MFLGCKCCEQPCNTTTQSGGSGITVNRYAMPEYGGNVSFSYGAYSVPDRFTIYNTQNENEIYFDTGGLVSGSRSINFYKPDGVKSVSVRVEGPQSNTRWFYTIGCPQISCLQINCQQNPLEKIESITLTLDVPSYTLKIPRLGMEYWYQNIDYRYLIPGTTTIAKIPQKIARILPLGAKFVSPYTLKNPRYDPDYAVPPDSPFYSPVLGSPVIYSVGARNFAGAFGQNIEERRVVGPDDYVRPDELPEDPENGWFGGADIRNPAHFFYGKWEFVGKVEFSAEYSIDGDYYSGTYELQKVAGTNDEYIYYFDDDEPTCNKDHINVPEGISTFPLDGIGYPKSFIAIKGCTLYISNLKAKYKYGFVDGDPQCPYNNDIENFSFSGYTPIISSVRDLFTGGLSFSSLFDIGNEWDTFSNLITVDSDRVFDARTNLSGNPCYQNKSGLGIVSMDCSPSAKGGQRAYSVLNNAPSIIYEPLNRQYAFSMAQDYGITNINSTFAPDGNRLGHVYLGGQTWYKFRGIVNDSNMSEIERLLFQVTGRGLYQFVAPNFMRNSYALTVYALQYINSGRLDLININDPSIYSRGQDMPTGIALPWIPTYLFGAGYYDERSRFIYTYDPYYDPEEDKYWGTYDVGAQDSGRNRCTSATSLNPFSEDSCGKCFNYWYRDNGMWIEEMDKDRQGEIFVRNITVNRE